MQLERGQQLPPRGVHLNYFRKYTAVRQIAFLGGTDRRAIMRRLITQILSAAPLSSRRDRRGGPPRILLAREEETSARAKSRLVQTTSRSRRTRTVPLFRVGNIPRTFLYPRTFARGQRRRGRRAHVLQCSPRSVPLSGALQPALRRQIVEILTGISVVLSPRTPAFSPRLCIRAPRALHVEQARRRRLRPSSVFSSRRASISCTRDTRAIFINCTFATSQVRGITHATCTLLQTAIDYERQSAVHCLIRFLCLDSDRYRRFRTEELIDADKARRRATRNRLDAA